ncbi:MAG: hydroxymethylglutaryl-CoA lyase [Betaproteobacteria bacterium]|nr:hydroxymethylglutaryl-CoA lyase [Betaproteobacteria bacterium]
MHIPSRVIVREVSARDGLQSEKTLVSTAHKIELLNRIASAGFQRINAVSFVSPEAVPQMADSEAVMAGITRAPGVLYDASTANVKGARRAVAAGVDALSVFIAATETSNRKNVRRSIAESMAAVPAVVEVAAAAGIPVTGTIIGAFGCPYEGEVSDVQILSMASQYVEAGCSGFLLGDTTGVANPVQVERIVGKMLDAYPDRELYLHFHNTRGAGLANVVAAINAGATMFDASLAGIGGCPFIAGASGNIVTEDLVHMLHDMGIETGIDIDAVLDAAKFVSTLIPRPTASHLLVAGKRTKLLPA